MIGYKITNYCSAGFIFNVSAYNRESDKYLISVVMIRKLAILLIIACCFSCHKSNQQSACGTQECTKNNVVIGVSFTNQDGSGVTVKDYSAINQRTHAKVFSPGYYDTVPGFYVLADDSMRDQFSTEGDDVVITGTHTTTGQTKTVTYKISGGCNCHVEKVSGVSPVVFN
jgi:hypothetical protein